MTTHGTDLAGFNSVLQSMAQADFFTGILPFVLTFTVLYPLVLRLPFLNDLDDSSKINPSQIAAMVSVSAGLYVSYFMVTNPIYQSFFTGFLGRIGIGLVGLLAFLVLFGFTGISYERLKVPVFALIVVAITFSAFTLSGGTYAFLPQGAPVAQISTLLFEDGLIWLLVIAGALYWVTRDSSEEEGGGLFTPFRVSYNPDEEQFEDTG